MRLVATAKHKTLKREFRVLEIDLENQRVKCEGSVERHYCVLCEQMGRDKECPCPWFRIDAVELSVTEEK